VVAKPTDGRFDDMDLGGETGLAAEAASDVGHRVSPGDEHLTDYDCPAERAGQPDYGGRKYESCGNSMLDDHSIAA
jgi:hypothetical protein